MELLKPALGLFFLGVISLYDRVFDLEKICLETNSKHVE